MNSSLRNLLLNRICYSTGKKQYLLVMTESSAGQSFHWGISEALDYKWVKEKYHNGLYPTIIFHDPSDDLVVVVMTSNSNRSGYQSSNQSTF